MEDYYPDITAEKWDQELSEDHIKKLAPLVVDWEKKLYPAMKNADAKITDADVDDIKFISGGDAVKER